MAALERELNLYFDYARKRYEIFLKRQEGLPPPWTNNHILQHWRFCNVFREDDKVTIWFKENIREPMRCNPKVIFATIAFRWFNSINAGEVIRDLVLYDNWDFALWYERLDEVRKRDGRIVTGAYMIKTPPILDKISGILQCLRQAKELEDEIVAVITEPGCSLERAWQELCRISYMGGFTSYEVVTDLRHTAWLENAPDIMSWANPGPGCAAGMGELIHKDRKYYNRHNQEDREEMMDIMAIFLEASQKDKYWPNRWPQWEMREVEHTFCETDKYMRGEQGLRLKRKFNHAIT